MAYGLKYELLCTTKKGNLYTVKIYFDGYTGDPIDRNVPKSPFKLRKDKAAIVRGTTFNLSIREEVDFEFLEFYTNSSKKIKFELYDPSNTIIWAGYNLPQQYQVPYTPAPANVNFTASDGLGLLKSEDYTLNGINSQLTIIRHCIDKIGITLDYSIAINLFEATHDEELSCLDQTFEDSEIFAGMNCYDVLEKILNKYNAEITQSRGKWRITRNADKKSSRMLYSSSGTYTGTEAAPTVLNLGQKIGTAVQVTPRNSLQLTLEPGGKKVKVSHQYGRKNSLLTNPDFSKFTSPDFVGWIKEGSFTPEQRFSDNGPFLLIPGNNDTHDNLSQEIEIENSPGDVFVFTMDIGVLAYKLYGGIPVSIPVTIKFVVALLSGETMKFLARDGDHAVWSDTLATIDHVVASQPNGIPKLNSLTFYTNEIPFSGTLKVILYRIETPQLYEHTYTGVAFSNVNLFFKTNGALYPAGELTQASFDNSTEPSELSQIDILAADAPDLPNAGLLYKNITKLASGAITTKWHILGSSAEYTLLQQMGLALASDNRIARQKLTGDIRGTSIAFDSIIKHPYNNNREFEIAEGVWDIYEEVFNCTLLELLAWSDETVTFSSVLESNSSSSSSGGGYSSSGTGQTVSTELGTMEALAKYFEVVNPGTEDEYLRCKLPFAGDYEIQAWTNNLIVENSKAFQTPAFANPLELDATINKDFICGAITGNTTINLNNTIDGDAGMIKVSIDSTGGYTVTLGSMFTEKLGETDLDVNPNMKNYISWRKVGTNIVYTIAQIV